MLNSAYKAFASLGLSLWLTAGVMALLAAGSFLEGENSSLNEMPLFIWLIQTPIGISWWLWGVIGLIAVLFVNTVICSIESLRSRVGSGNFMLKAAPQVMHAGFLAMILAHAFSASGSMKQGGSAVEGMSLQMPDGSAVMVDKISARIGAMGMPTGYSATIRGVDGRTVNISPNHPYFFGGYGLYLKNVDPFPVPTAYLELHREPGAGIALVGAVIYMIGNVTIIALRRRR